jgi:hypothetical protein
MPPEPMTDLSSNCRKRIGIIMRPPQLLQTVVSSGAKSLGMNTLVWHPGHATIVRVFLAG